MTSKQENEEDRNIEIVLLSSSYTLDISEVHDNEWAKLFEEVKTFCNQHNIIVPKMDDTITVWGRSRGRGGQLVTYYHHFNNEIFIVVYDQVIVELNNHFIENLLNYWDAFLV